VSDAYELVTAAELDAIVTGIVEPLLTPAGFTLGARRKWVRARPPVRHLFELCSLRGVFVPRWALSLDFVPHPKAGGLGWHRTDKSALADLAYDPVDFDPAWSRRWSISGLEGSAGVRRDAARVLPAAVQAARAWFEGAEDVHGARARAEWLDTADRPGRGFGPDNWVQQRLAYAFLLARTGAADEARVQLDRWIRRGEHEGLRGRLTDLLEKSVRGED